LFFFRTRRTIREGVDIDRVDHGSEEGEMEPTLDAAGSQQKTAGFRYVECPHCHHEVMERADGKCLACGKNRLETAGVNPEMTMLTIENISELPACCFMCGTDTRRMQEFSWTFLINPYSLSPWMIPLVRLMSYLPGSEYRTTERLRLPTCPECGKQAKKVKPLSVWSGLDCRMEVHRIFRQRFEEVNGKARLEWEAESRVNTAPRDERVFLSGVGMKI